MTDIELTELIQYINNQMHECPQELDNFFERVDVSRMEIVEMITYMRSTFVLRNKLTNWKDFVIRCKNEIDRRDGRGEKLTKGLLND